MLLLGLTFDDNGVECVPVFSIHGTGSGVSISNPTLK